MKRKVVAHGPATLTISLPSDWAKKYHIQKGDLLTVSAQNQILKIMPDVVSSRKEITVDLTDLDRTAIVYVLRSLYRSGFDHVVLTFSKDQALYYRSGQFIAIRDIIREELIRVVGFEIVEDNPSSIVIDDLSKSSGDDFDVVVRRIFLLIKQTHFDLVELLVADTHEAAIEDAQNNVTKLISYCMRMLNKSSSIAVDKTCYYYHLLGMLDRIMDVVVTIAKQKKSTAISVQTSKDVAEAFTDFYTCFYSFDLKMFSRINLKRHAIEQAAATDILSQRFLLILELMMDLLEARCGLEY